MTSTIKRDFVVKDGRATFPMKEYPNWCGIPDIGFIYYNSWADSDLEYNGKIFNEHIVSDAMYASFIEDFPEKDGDYEAFAQYIYDHRDEVYELLEDWSDGNENYTDKSKAV